MYLISRIYKELPTTNSTTNNLIRKYLTRHFSKDDIKMANKVLNITNH